MTGLSIPARPRFGLRAGVLTVSALLVAGTALLVSSNVSDHLAQAAIHEAIRTTQSVVVGEMNPPVTADAMANPDSAAGQAIDAELVKLASGGRILRIKIWSPTGQIVFSDLPALRGMRFGIDSDLGDALSGSVGSDIGSASDPENEFERFLAPRLLSIYLPIPGANGTVIGAYEIYEDAAPIEADIATTRTDVLLIVGGMALGLLALLYAAFAGASRRLADQNRKLREQAVTEQLLMTDIRRSEERFRSLVRNSADVNMIVAPDGVIQYESPAVERVLGYRPKERIGTTGVELFHPDDQERVLALFNDLAKSPNAQITTEIRIRHADGTYRLIEATGKNLVNEPAVGGIVVNYRDISERRLLEDELRHQAFHDSLTGLANRALFADRLEHALNRTKRSRHRLAVLFLDLDDFKTINDSLGHGEGDQLLVSVAGRLREAVRAGDTIARMGGDEFAILVEDASNGSPMEVAERLQGALQTPFNQGGKELFVHASVGVAVSASSRETPEELLRNADASMYMAKSHGKNRIEVFEPSMHAAALTRLAIKGDLERALERGEFDVLYQPIVRLGTRELMGVEALVRWRHPERGLILPGEFIPVAEETGQIIPIGQWIMERACRQARLWETVLPGRRLAMSVNVSGRQVAEPDFVATVSEILRDSGLDPERLILEFTEGILMRDTELTTTTMDDLKALGVRLAIDDFGTGFSALNYLRSFPIDVLKIDGSFVASMSAGPDQRAVVRAILRLGETLHLQTIAEGIEDAGQLADLRALGATLGQGYFFARALNADEISVMLATEEARPPRLADRFVA
ncbi:MAG TPA: EAL domain-containing protein [Candidatus Limnocylindrales bacterium]|nr:EAL domain-containing protein [Candidatus Limnocylindrales bacterium]